MDQIKKSKLGVELINDFSDSQTDSSEKEIQSRKSPNMSPIKEGKIKEKIKSGSISEEISHMTSNSHHVIEVKNSNPKAHNKNTKDQKMSYQGECGSFPQNQHNPQFYSNLQGSNPQITGYDSTYYTGPYFGSSTSVQGNIMQPSLQSYYYPGYFYPYNQVVGLYPPQMCYSLQNLDAMTIGHDSGVVKKKKTKEGKKKKIIANEHPSEDLLNVESSKSIRDKPENMSKYKDKVSSSRYINSKLQDYDYNYQEDYEEPNKMETCTNLSNKKKLTANNKPKEALSNKHLYEKSKLSQENSTFAHSSKIISDMKTLKQFIESFSSNKELVNYICTVKGCRLLQSSIGKLNPQMLSYLIENIGDKFPQIIKNPYANYFFQKITHLCNKNQRIVIIRNISNEFIDLAHNMSGTHALQALIEVVKSEEEAELILDCLVKNLLSLSKVS